MTATQKMMGFEVPGDQKVPVRVRDWNAMKLAIWRSKYGWEIVTRAASELLEGCAHTEGCPGKENAAEPCFASCPDRELRMSALVILSASKTCAPVDARKPADGSYFAPSREYFSEVLAELSAAQLENEALHEVIRHAGVASPAPPPNEPPALPARPAPAQLEEKNT